MSTKLILLTGPRGSGKSLMARSLEANFRADGKTVRVFDDMPPRTHFARQLADAQVLFDYIIVTQVLGERASATIGPVWMHFTSTQAVRRPGKGEEGWMPKGYAQ